MVISDLHYENAYHHGIWEGEAHGWLLRMVRSVRPASLIALGDLGHAWLPADWEGLTNMVPVMPSTVTTTTLTSSGLR
jgi:metallophosphoesterase superfamily enzyme